MGLLARAFVIGGAIEAICALPFAFGAGEGPCNLSTAGLFALLTHPFGLVASGVLSMLVELPRWLETIVVIATQALAWVCAIHLILWWRLRRAIRRADALPTI